MYPPVLVYGVILVLCGSGIVAQNFFGAFQYPQNVAKCGRSEGVGKIRPLIINGSEASTSSFPWHAGLYYREVKNKTEFWDQKCGGSLITDQFVLTAAHCVFNSKEADVRVALGKVYRSWDRYEYGEQKRNVSQITYPYDFDSQVFYFDIALLLLDKKITLGELVMPVCTGLLSNSNHLFNKKFLVAGWGQTKSVQSGSSSETLLYTDVMIMPQRSCKHFVPFQIILFDKFCTMNNSDDSVAQPGDSGGGLTVEHEGLHYIFGIISVKIKKGIDKELTFFTNISWPTHLWWIENEVRKQDTKFRWSGDKEQQITVTETSNLQRDSTPSTSSATPDPPSVTVTSFTAGTQKEVFKCPDDYGFYPHPVSCDKYWKCNNNVAELKTCGNGLAFDDTDPKYLKENCDYLYNIDCGDRAQLEPAISTPHCPWQHGIFPDEVHCDIFWNCWDGEARRSRCSPGLAFERETRKCIHADQVPECKDSKVADKFSCPATGLSAGNLTRYAHPEDCRKYYICLEGISRGYECPIGTVFKIGDSDGTGNCEDSKDVPGCEDYYGDLDLKAIRKN